LKRLAIITTHPIQYYAPVFRLLHQRQKIQVMVFYTWGPASLKRYDPGFGENIEWDIPLLNGYDYQWVKNTSDQPGSHHYNGIVNPDLVPQVAAWDPDAVLVFGWAYNSHLKALRHFKKKALVYFRGDSTLLDEQKGLKSILKMVFLKWVYGHIDHAFYVGQNNKAYFKKYGLKNEQLTFAPHAIDNSRFAADKGDEVTDLKNRLGIRMNDLVVLFAGKLEKKKAPSLLLNAFIELNRPDLHLIFVGEGPLKTELKNSSAPYANIHFLGFQNQTKMPVIYQLCDVFCLPSIGPAETWGLAVNEAMACGKAIIVSDKTGCAVDLVKDNFNGLIFKSGNHDALLTAINELTLSKSTLMKYGANSALLIADWNFKNIAETVENRLNHDGR
jgi:glycosyltransferase involved in cell wall biosynthesis